MSEVKYISKYGLGENMEFGFPFSIFRWKHPSDDDIPRFLFRRNFWKIVYVLAGEGIFEINGNHYPISSGTLLVVHPNALTTYHLGKSSLDLYNLCFMPEIVVEQLARMDDKFAFFSIFQKEFSPRNSENQSFYIQKFSKNLRHLFERINKEYRKGASNQRELLCAYLIELLITVERNGIQSMKASRNAGIVKNIRSYLEQNFHSDLDYNSLASGTNLSRSRLSVIYRKETGENISTSLLKIRMKEAEKMLISETNLSVQDISIRCGFTDLSFFYRVFRRIHGISPGSFRNNSASIDS